MKFTIPQRVLLEADEDQRRAERQAKLTGSSSEKAQALLQRVRLGQIKPENLALAAAMRDEAAEIVADQFGLERPQIPLANASRDDGHFDYFNKVLSAANSFSIEEIADFVGGLANVALTPEEREGLNLYRNAIGPGRKEYGSAWDKLGEVAKFDRSSVVFYIARMYYYASISTRANFIDAAATVLRQLVTTQSFVWVENAIINWLLGAG